MKYLPYGRQTITEEDITAVVEVLRSDWLTTGPSVDRFERSLAEFTGATHAVAVSSGTAALHAAMHALAISPGDEVIVSPMTFAATANAVLYCGGVPVFADVNAGSLLIDPARVSEKITERTRAIIAVDYAGQPCDYRELREIANRYGLTLVADGCHAIGACYNGQNVGNIADLTAFSFHPVKHITTGEGGMVTTDDPDLATRMRRFRNHGITNDHRQRAEAGSYFYEMVELGFNYRISDFQCALGASQLIKLPAWLKQRASLAEAYDDLLAEVDGIAALKRLPGRTHAFHLYVVRVDAKRSGRTRDDVFIALRRDQIACNVHYLPVYLHPFYKQRFGHEKGLCPVAEAAYDEILSLPIFPGMQTEDVARVVTALKEACRNED